MDLAIHPRDHDLVIGTHGRGIWIVDDITPLRALTPETLSQDVVFIETKPSIQRISGPGGWMNGDAAFVGPNPPDEASVTYYQKRRHIFGDLKMEVLDAEGKPLSTVPTSKRRGLSRATWAMRLKPPQVPSAAIAAGGAFMGPRVLPGTYTVKLTKDQHVYDSKLQVSADPRAKHSTDERQAQFNLSMKLYNLLGDMTYAVERINAVRLGLEERIAKLSKDDPLAKRLRTAGAETDGFRKKIVATKEGGMITGEERLREFLAELYGNVVGYEGRPSQTQMDRAQTIERELADVVKDFETWVAKELPGVNSAITQKQMAPVTPPTREDWEKRSSRK
jgi:hypothetical protein